MTTTLVAIGVSLGPPVSSAQIPTTDSSLSGYIAQAVTDTASLATSIGTTKTASTAGVASLGTASTQTTTVSNDSGTVTTDIATTTTDVATAQTNFDTAMALLATFVTGATYVGGSTHQFTVNASGSSTITQANMNSVIADINTALTALITAKAALATASTDNGTLATAVATLVSDVSAAVAAVGTTNTDVQALATTAISTDLTNAQGNNLPSGMAMFIQADNSKITTLGAFSGALQSALQFATAEGYF